MKKRYRGLLLFLFFMISFFRSSAQRFDVDTLLYNGQTREYINLVILGDGYTAAQLEKYIADARNFTKHLFKQAPYNSYQRYFNVFAIKVPSAEEGVKHPGSTPTCPSDFPVSNPNNYFGTTFDVSNTHRLVVPAFYNKMALVLANNFPEYDQVVLLANSTEYGGSGGTYATATLNGLSDEIAFHEMGHSFAGLADEYWAGDAYAQERPNMTKEMAPSLVKWKNWLTPGTGIGVYQHGNGTFPWYKPADKTCKMEHLGGKFCAVCSETIVEKIHTLFRPIGKYSPASMMPRNTYASTDNFYVSVQEIKPTPNTLKTEWQLNGAKFGGNKDSVLVTPGRLQEGLNTLSVSLIDTTTLSRSNAHLTNHRYTLNWTFDHSSLLPVLLTFFQAEPGTAGVTLTWETAMEINHDRFEIERSPNGRDWDIIGTVQGEGNSHLPHPYVFFDNSLALHQYPTIYYRLKQLDVDGHFQYSSVEAVKGQALGTRVRLLGNPVQEQLHLEISGLPETQVTLWIFNPDGSRVLEMPVTLAREVEEIQVPVAGLVPGIYFYSLLLDKALLDSGRFLKVSK